MNPQSKLLHPHILFAGAISSVRLKMSFRPVLKLLNPERFLLDISGLSPIIGGKNERM